MTSCSFLLVLFVDFRLRTWCSWINLMPHGNFRKESTTLYLSAYDQKPGGGREREGMKNSRTKNQNRGK